MKGTGHGATGTADDPPFGARFLAEYRRLGGLLSGFSWAELQEIKGCDREGLVRAQRQAGAAVAASSIWLLLAALPR